MNNNMTPEQMAQFQQEFGGRGGRGGSGRGNRQQQQPSNAVVGDMTPITERNANKIDELFESVPKRIQPGQVWLYDEKAADPNEKLRQVNVRLGLTDGQFSELVTAGENLTAGTMVVTGVVPPPSALPKPGQNNIFQQQRGGFGGPQPGGGPGGPGGGGGARRRRRWRRWRPRRELGVGHEAAGRGPQQGRSCWGLAAPGPRRLLTARCRKEECLRARN